MPGLRRLIQSLNNKISKLMTNDDNYRTGTLVDYKAIVDAVSNALPGQNGQCDNAKIADLKACAQLYKNHQYHPNTGLRKLAGLMLMIAGCLAALYFAPTDLANPYAVAAGIGGIAAGAWLFKKGYGLFSHGAEYFPASKDLENIADNIEKLNMRIG